MVIGGVGFRWRLDPELKFFDLKREKYWVSDLKRGFVWSKGMKEEIVMMKKSDDDDPIVTR